MNKQNNHSLNYYIKSPEARFLIRLIAAAGYVLLGIVWWILYGITTLCYWLYQLVAEVVETLYVCLEAISEILKRLHKSMSYAEMLLSAVELMTLIVLGILALYVMVVALALLPIQ